jgi:hypothetical protein
MISAPLDASIAAMGIAWASIVKIARPAAKAIETNLFIKVSFPFRNRHNRRSHLRNGPDMNVCPTVAVPMHGLRSHIREDAIHVDEQLQLQSFNKYLRRPIWT